MQGSSGTGSGTIKTTTDYLRDTDGLPNALPFTGAGAAKPAPRFYADVPAATTSAATACSAAVLRAPWLALQNQFFCAVTDHQSRSTKRLTELPRDVFADIRQSINASIDCDGRHRTVIWRGTRATASTQTTKRRKGKNNKES
jgi:hypothetical protein